MKAEYVACFKVICHVIWLQNFICDLGVVDFIKRLIKMHYDNSITVSFSNNLKSLQRAKYFDVKFYKVKEKIAKSLITIEHMPTHNMMVDPLSKDLLVRPFKGYVSSMRLWSN